MAHFSSIIYIMVYAGHHWNIYQYGGAACYPSFISAGSEPARRPVLRRGSNYPGITSSPTGRCLWRQN
ncbi:hypothetical protein [Desulfotruncus arcticus]|uniref:hypothetical protein n=1 Tax=Desulfotruncus arcticus TaxID=341036 RepID=UPI000B866608|nr:hypothetical protein [Desulfotruncus arcticus]